MDLLTAAAWAVSLSVLAYWLGWRAGMARAWRLVAAALARCGVRDFDTERRSITFRDGTQHTENGA